MSIILGLFALHDTHGLPLSVAISEILERGFVPGMFDGYQCARRAGWDHDRAIRWLTEGVQDSSAPMEWRAGALSRIAELDALAEQGKRATT